MSIKKEKICVLDLETTGFEPEDSEIEEIFILKVSNHKIVDVFYSLINPKNIIQNSHIHGITDEKVRNATSLEEINNEILDKQIKTESLDVTLSVSSPSGTIHPITQVIDEVIAIFADLDFCVAEGPEIETDYNNFTALNLSLIHI